MSLIYLLALIGAELLVVVFIAGFEIGQARMHRQWLKVMEPESDDAEQYQNDASLTTHEAA